MGGSRIEEGIRSVIINHLRAWFYAIGRCRFSFIILIAGFGLLMSDQGRDLLITHAEDGHLQMLHLTIWASVWAFSIWGWARTLLDIDFENLPDCLPCYNRARRWLARLLGGFAFIVVGWSAYQGGQNTLSVYTIIGFVVFSWFVIKRRAFSNKMAAKAKRSQNRFMQLLARLLEAPEIKLDERPPYKDLKSALHFPTRRRDWLNQIEIRTGLCIGLGVIWGLLLVWAIVSPVNLGLRFGPMILFFLWGATWLPVGTWISYAADKHRIPLLIGLLLLAVASSWTNDNHEIRLAENPGDIDGRPSVTSALDRWRQENARQNEPVPFVVVATAGGGIRAAYWTGTVLGTLHDNSPQFARRLFGISGVSGGSVGATVYRALLELEEEQTKGICPDGMMSCIQNILSRDLLGPVAAGLLFPDLIQRFLFFPCLPDRGTALEKGWEVAFERVTDSKTLGMVSMADLSKEHHHPALFLNATWTDNGRRIVASNLLFASAKTADQNEDDEVDAFARSNDQLAILGRDLRLSTAAHNSARFPFLSPPGMWRNASGDIAGRLQDGGLFENYGAETALEILDLACRKFDCIGEDKREHTSPGSIHQEKTRVIPVVILISSDPNLQSERLAASESKNTPIKWGYEIRSTLRAFERTRGGRGREAAHRLEKWAEENGRFAHFHMCDPNIKGVQPPLGWSLSQAATQRIESYLIEKEGRLSPSCYKNNHAEFEKLQEILNAQS
jgi:hypothetical protein